MTDSKRVKAGRQSSFTKFMRKKVPDFSFKKHFQAKAWELIEKMREKAEAEAVEGMSRDTAQDRRRYSEAFAVGRQKFTFAQSKSSKIFLNAMEELRDKFAEETGMDRNSAAIKSLKMEGTKFVISEEAFNAIYLEARTPVGIWVKMKPLKDFVAANNADLSEKEIERKAFAIQRKWHDEGFKTKWEERRDNKGNTTYINKYNPKIKRTDRPNFI
jgi:hypothetical protein